MEKKYLGIILALVAFFGVVGYYSLTYNNKDKLCVVEIPNQVVFKCPAGNETRDVQSFQTSLFEYENAIRTNCTIKSNNTEIKTFSYEICKCNSSLPFRIIK